MAHELEKTKQNLLNRDYTTNTDEHMNKCETKPCVGSTNTGFKEREYTAFHSHFISDQKNGFL